MVRPPGEVPPSQELGPLDLPSSAQRVDLPVPGGSIYIPSGDGTNNRHSWAGSINTPGEQNHTGIPDWRANGEPPAGMEDVRVCCDCLAGSSPGQSDYRSTPGNSTVIHRTWNGSGSPTRPSASDLWATPGLNTPDANGRRRRQSVSLENMVLRSVPDN